MTMRIRTNVESLTAQRQLTSNSQDMSNSSEKLSSGYRINKSADDAAGLAISENLRGKVRGLNQAKRNANDGVSLIQVAESGLTEVTNIMVRLKELSVQAASDTFSNSERGYLQKEYAQLVDEVDRISATTEFNGLKLLADNSTNLRVQVGYNGTENDSIKIDFTDEPGGINSETLGIKGTQIADVERDVIAGNLKIIDDALQKVNNTRATLGANQSRLNSTIQNIGVTAEGMQAANSRIRDVDFAEETAKYTQARILSSAGLSVLTQANQKPEMALSLLR